MLADGNPAQTRTINKVGLERNHVPDDAQAAYAHALPDASFEVLRGCGHWPWIDQPSVIDRVIRFLGR